MMLVIKTCIKMEFVNSILTYKNIIPKLLVQSPNFGNHCLETECSQTSLCQTPTWFFPMIDDITLRAVLDLADSHTQSRSLVKLLVSLSWTDRGGGSQRFLRYDTSIR